MEIIDLSSPIAAARWEPNPVQHEVMSPAEGARHMAQEMELHFGLAFEADDLPGKELLSLDTLTLTTHTGTHVDAPSHYGSTTRYGEPRHIDQLPLEWFLGPGVLLDMRDEPVGAIGADRLAAEFDRIGHTPQPGEIVLLRTGADGIAGTPAYFTDLAGLDAAATGLRLDRGLRALV